MRKMKNFKNKMTDPDFMSKVSLVVATVNLAVAILVLLLKNQSII